MIDFQKKKGGNGAMVAMLLKIRCSLEENAHFSKFALGRYYLEMFEDTE